MFRDIFHALALAGILAAAMMMHGCTATATATGGTVDQTPTSSLQDFLSKIQNITVDDANAALADVHAHGDVDLAALQCYPALIEFVQSSPLQPSMPTVSGVLSVNQIKRDVMLGGVTRTGPFQVAFRKLHVACAAYAGDEARFAAEFAAMIGAASHGVPALPQLGGVVGGVMPVK